LGNYQELRFDPRLRTEGRGQKAEDRGRKSEGGGQRAEVRRWKTEDSIMSERIESFRDLIVYKNKA
jgi:hypothetical protein